MQIGLVNFFLSSISNFRTLLNEDLTLPQFKAFKVQIFGWVFEIKLKSFYILADLTEKWPEISPEAIEIDFVHKSESHFNKY